METCSDYETFVSNINEIFSENIPFNRLLGFQVESISYERVRVDFLMRPDLMGHYRRGMLHGGVLSSVIDVTGGLSAFMGLQEKMPGVSLDVRLKTFGRVSTIDLRVNFLLPGTGKRFVATAYPLRTGNKVAVTRTEVVNDRDELIAVGTGSYIVA